MLEEILYCFFVHGFIGKGFWPLGLGKGQPILVPFCETCISVVFIIILNVWLLVKCPKKPLRNYILEEVDGPESIPSIIYNDYWVLTNMRKSAILNWKSSNSFTVQLIWDIAEWIYSQILQGWGSTIFLYAMIILPWTDSSTFL